MVQVGGVSPPVRHQEHNCGGAISLFFFFFSGDKMVYCVLVLLFLRADATATAVPQGNTAVAAAGGDPSLAPSDGLWDRRRI